MSEMRSGEKLSSFSATCSRLSQFLKEKRNFGDLSLGIAPRAHQPPKGVFRPPTTMSLLPGVDVSADDQTETGGDASDRNVTNLFPQHTGFSPAAPVEDGAGKRPDPKEPENTQLTIFYGGKVLILDNFPAAKVKDLMQMASTGSSAPRNFGSATPSSVSGLVADRPPPATSSVVADRPPPATSGGLPPRPSQPIASDLPIARRASLHRFLEKRKNRINSVAPYQVNGSSAVVAPAKLEAVQPWLGLGQRVSKPGLIFKSSR